MSGLPTSSDVADVLTGRTRRNQAVDQFEAYEHHTRREIMSYSAVPGRQDALQVVWRVEDVVEYLRESDGDLPTEMARIECGDEALTALRNQVEVHEDRPLVLSTYEL